MQIKPALRDNKMQSNIFLTAQRNETQWQGGQTLLACCEKNAKNWRESLGFKPDTDKKQEKRTKGLQI